MSEVTDYLLARINERELYSPNANTRELCAWLRRIVEMHASWPILVEGPLEVEKVDPHGRVIDDPLALVNHYTYRASRQIAWATEQEYIRKFGKQPPTAPLIKDMLKEHAWRSDFKQEWLEN